MIYTPRIREFTRQTIKNSVGLAGMRYMENQWTSITSCPLSTYGHVARASGGLIYSGLGFNGTSNSSSWYSYNPATNAWTQKASYGGTAFRFGISGAVGSKIYAGTGYTTDTVSNQWYMYDTSTNTWTQKANFPASIFGGVSAVVDTKIYAGLGYNLTSNLTNWYAYDTATDQWSSLAPWPTTATNRGIAVALNGKIYAGTGMNTSGSTFYQYWYMYNPSNDTWTQKTNFPLNVYAPAAEVSNGHIYVGTGYSSQYGYERSWWIYNDTANTWAQKADYLGSASIGAAASANVGDKIYMGGGWTGSTSLTNWYIYK